MVLSTIGRLIWLPIAFLLAALLAVMVLVTLGLERFTQSTAGQWQDGDVVVRMFDMLLQGQVIVSGLTLLPAVAVVIVGEVARIRSSLYYVLGGGLALVSIPLLARYGPAGGSELPEAVVWQVMATAGFAGGFVYWLLAGRRA